MLVRFLENKLHGFATFWDLELGFGASTNIQDSAEKVVLLASFELKSNVKQWKRWKIMKNRQVTVTGIEMNTD